MYAVSLEERVPEAVVWLPLEVRVCRKGRRESREEELDRSLVVLGFFGTE